MTTLWKKPTLISQFSTAEDQDIPWDTNPLSLPLQLNGTLKHISRSPKHDIKNKTWTVKATGFNFDDLPNSINGIELRLTVKRGGRARDDFIELCYEDLPIGENKASKEVLPTITYGGNTDIWAIDNVSKEMLENPSFGIMMRFKAHPDWPHQTNVQIDSVEMRIH